MTSTTVFLLLCLMLDWGALQRVTSRRAEEANQRLEEKNILDSILNDQIYDARIRPATMDTMDGPTNINVNLMIRSIDKIDDVKMEFSTQITFRCPTATFPQLNQCLGTSKHFQNLADSNGMMTDCSLVTKLVRK